MPKTREAYKQNNYTTPEAVALQMCTLVIDAIQHRRVGSKTYVTAAEAFTALVRSQVFIEPLHLYTASLLDLAGVSPGTIFYEVPFKTPYEPKNVDVAVLPTATQTTAPAISTDKTAIAVGCKSSIASIAKNKVNNFDSARSDITRLHEEENLLVVGHMQLIVVQEIVPDAKAAGHLAWKKSFRLAEHIYQWHLNNSRGVPSQNPQRPEAAALLIIDPETGKVYYTNDELIDDGWLTQEEVDHFGFDVTALAPKTLIPRLLTVHKKRFPNALTLRTVSPSARPFTQTSTSLVAASTRKQATTSRRPSNVQLTLLDG